MALAALVSGVVVAGGGAVGGSEPVPEAQRYRVRAGDTLWAIARQEVGPQGDPRPLIADIRAMNDLSSPALQPGQILAVP